LHWRCGTKNVISTEVMPKLVRITTVPMSLNHLLSGQMQFMKNHGFEVTMISADGEEVEALKIKEGCKHIAVNLSRKISPIQDLISAWKLYFVLRKIKPDIVHTHTPKAGLIGMMTSWLLRVPVRLHTVAGLPLMEATGLKRKVLEATEKITYYCASRVYPNSKNLSTFILNRKFCKEEKIKVLGNGSSNGINTEYFNINDEIASKAFELKRQWGIKQDDFVFIFIGRVVRDKGIVELIEAFTSLKKNQPNIKLLLVGGFEQDLDPLPPKTSADIKEDASIIHVGYQPDVRPYLAISKALVFPSYREGFPNVPMQAGCFNLPAIVTNINGCNEIIVDGVNGLIVPKKDKDALRDAMQRIIADSDLYAYLTSNARSMIVNRYDHSQVCSLLLDEYFSYLN
jgi:glycosyltransferase involved in cell wall biosynthesis